MESSKLSPVVILENVKKKFPKKRKNHIKISPIHILFFLLAFFSGRTTLFSSVRPFGGAFFAAAFSGRASFIYALGAIFGMFLSGADLSKIGQYIFAMSVFSLIFEKPGHKGRENIIVRSAVFSLSLVLSGLFFMISASRGGDLILFYDCVMLFIEAVIAFCATAAFSTALPIVKRMSLSLSFSSAQEISLVLLFGSALCGAKDVLKLGPVNIAETLCILLVLIFSVRLGAARGAVAGLTMGLISALGGSGIDAGCVSFAVSGLAAGLCGLYGAVPGCSAFILANALVTALANGSTEVLINIYDIFAACILYGAIPEKVLSRITGFGARDETERAATDERLYLEHILGLSGSVLSRLEKRVDILDGSRKAKKDEELRFFERTARIACSSCGMRRLCWNRDIHRTCQALRRALDSYGESGEMSDEFLPRNCLRPKEFADAFVRMSELYRSDLIWREKLDELKLASRSQLKALNEIFSAVSRRARANEKLDRALSDDISRRMDGMGIACSDVVVLRDDDLDPTVILTLSSCGGFSLCDNGVRDVVSEACGREMVRAGRRDCKSCTVRYVAAPPSKMDFAFVSKAVGKKSVSGDTALFRVINKSLCAAVLCDGMGSGEKAAYESVATAETLLDLIEIGIDGEKALEIVNSLFLPFGEVTFSSADLCLYDALSNKAKIIKCGGAVTFSKSGERVDAMYSKSLPVGARIGRDVETYTIGTKGGDMIVMITDGILDPASKDGWIISEMEKYRGKDPADLCDIIVQKALLKCGHEPKDDMTVLAAYIE